MLTSFTTFFCTSLYFKRTGLLFRRKKIFLRKFIYFLQSNFLSHFQSIKATKPFLFLQFLFRKLCWIGCSTLGVNILSIFLKNFSWFFTNSVIPYGQQWQRIASFHWRGPRYWYSVTAKKNGLSWSEYLSLQDEDTHIASMS